MDDFQTYTVTEPDFPELTQRYDALCQALADEKASGKPGDGLLDLVRQWDQLRREIDTWRSLVEIRFEQDTRRADYKEALDRRDELDPKITDLDVRVKRLLLDEPLRAPVAKQFGQQAVALWESQVRAFDPVIEADLVEESKLASRYNQLLAGATLEFQGKTTNLSGIAQFAEDPDRQVRHDSLAITWQWFADNREELDDIYHRMVQLRDTMARKLNLADFVQLGYLRMNRVDYDRADVERYRQEVLQHIVPLCSAIRRQQAQGLKLDSLMFWDTAVYDKAGNPRPEGTYDEQVEQAQAMFDAMNDRLGQFFHVMRDKNLMDLQNRPGKAGGGFCAALLKERVPFIFANFNGTKGDVEVFTHEIGHAYQCYVSTSLPLLENVSPTYESCEIHSMSLEFLCWPHMERFFGDQADRFRRIHLLESLLFLPYGVAVDHFQHLVYENPSATPSERLAMWQDLERQYLPDTHYGDLPRLPDGGRWQKQRHIYMFPFYYIDYTLAQCCALQFWVRSRNDYGQAVQDYLALCDRGGTLPFQQLTASAGLRSPFEPGSLAEVAQHARQFLGLS